MTAAEVIRLAVWSGPRNISTAMMRSFENREDTVVVDEPFYAAYLARTGLDHPGRNEVLAAQPTDPVVVAEHLVAPLPDTIRVHYAKHMAHHVMPDDVEPWLARCRHVFLIRDPTEVVASYVRSRAECVPEDIGLLQQADLLDRLRTHGQPIPPVIDAHEFLLDPAGHLRWLCDWLEVPFSDRMLSWPSGPRDSDGVWSPYWYDAVLASTGFEPPRTRRVDLSEHDAAVARACRPAYDQLRALRVHV